MELLLEAGAKAVEIFGNSKLAISQLTEEYRCESALLFPLWVQCQELMAQFRYIISIGYLGYKIQRPMILHRWLRDTRLWQTEPILRYTYWTKEIGEPISSIT
jgi:hypothetical protein